MIEGCVGGQRGGRVDFNEPRVEVLQSIQSDSALDKSKLNPARASVTVCLWSHEEEGMNRCKSANMSHEQMQSANM